MGKNIKGHGFLFTPARDNIKDVVKNLIKVQVQFKLRLKFRFEFWCSVKKNIDFSNVRINISIVMLALE